jgi:hypothetical protein
MCCSTSGQCRSSCLSFYDKRIGGSPLMLIHTSAIFEHCVVASTDSNYLATTDWTNGFTVIFSDCFFDRDLYSFSGTLTTNIVNSQFLPADEASAAFRQECFPPPATPTPSFAFAPSGPLEASQSFTATSIPIGTARPRTRAPLAALPRSPRPRKQRPLKCLRLGPSCAFA